MGLGCAGGCTGGFRMYECARGCEVGARVDLAKKISSLPPTSMFARVPSCRASACGGNRFSSIDSRLSLLPPCTRPFDRVVLAPFQIGMALLPSSPAVVGPRLDAGQKEWVTTPPGGGYPARSGMGLLHSVVGGAWAHVCLYERRASECVEPSAVPLTWPPKVEQDVEWKRVFRRVSTAAATNSDASCGSSSEGQNHLLEHG